MASIPLTEISLASVKKSLRTLYPDIRSSHLSEALAASLHRRTHASLLSELHYLDDDPPIELLDETLFDQRLQQLGYPADPEFSFDWLDDGYLIKTVCNHAHTIKYSNLRDHAWRNLMVCTVNAAIEQKFISLRPGDNRWPNSGNRNGHVFHFLLPNGLRVKGYLCDAGWDELSIHAAVNPKGDFVRAAFAGFHAGDVYAAGWLERQKGAWLQSATDQFKCRQALLRPVAELQVKPKGYGDRGRVIM